MSALIRVFRASVKPGMTTEFQSFFLNEALPLVKSQTGMQRATVGLPSDGKPNEFIMISEWDSLESLKRFAGEDWNTAVIDPRESHLLVETAIDHYYQVDG
jgi:heme-degrading monooxygenase HmoA